MRSKAFNLFYVVLLIVFFYSNVSAQKKPENSVGFTLIPAMFEKIQYQINPEPYNLSSSHQLGFEAGFEYAINYRKLSVITGLRFGIVPRRMEFTVPDNYIQGISYNPGFNSAPIGGIPYLTLPVAIEKKWKTKQSYFFANVGSALKLPLLDLTNGTGVIYVTNNGYQQIISSTEEWNFGKDIRLHFLATIGKGFKLGKKNEGKIGLIANIATNPFMKTNITQYKQPSQEAVEGTYISTGNFVGVLLNFTINRIKGK